MESTKWPNSRLTTYQSGHPVQSQHLNAIQDTAIAHQAMLTSEHWATMGYHLFGPDDDLIARPVGDAFSVVANDDDLTVKIQPGVLLWRISPTHVLRHHLPAPIDVTVLRPAADRRYDCLSFKIEHVGSSGSASPLSAANPQTTNYDPINGTTLTVALSTGSASASASDPSVPAGMQKFCRLRVHDGPQFNTPGLTNLFVHDLRTPAGFGRLFVPLGLATGDWTKTPDGLRSQPGATLTLPIRFENAEHSRIKSISLLGYWNPDTSVLLGPKAAQVASDGVRINVGLDNVSQAITAVGDARIELMPHFKTFEGTELEPMWANGMHTPHSHRSTLRNWDKAESGTEVRIGGTQSSPADELYGAVVEWWGA